MSDYLKEFSWVGSDENFVDQPDIIQLDRVIIGRYGGNSKEAQYKNEDGCLVWINRKQEWEFTILMDAHSTSESAELILQHFNLEKSDLQQILSLPTNRHTFRKLENKILSIFHSEDFLTSCRQIRGETACLIVARKDKYVWWFSVGDCILYLFHPELAAMGQHQLNQRQFYEWIGQVNTFEQDVPCYSNGIRELRKGENHLFLTTDGLIECPNEPYQHPGSIFHCFYNSTEWESMQSILRTIQNQGVRDSTTIISWKVMVAKETAKPSG
ncbi:protein phosphatase 2C domain-containing protein [Bacillus sp. AGMB 02131]|uniref:Protein phosphatase 2C domain-containing protein n=1 Tax=Peribacillus faecalis TaxID=2772559 RepID=A0A927CU16_9BACI|nr:protein phosphatase 2C domain-containing protein [Peribacillus faecalis]MBD3107446.1 protein phosphatase 2C domain-containing protein [Peribacillus faecalis]